MKKNVASQVIGVQMISAVDGSAFTGSVTVYVTGNGGTQAIGSVGSGACTHKGNGLHTYAPAQAETNYDHVAFTFIGTGAIPCTVQVYTSFPQTGDAYARLGAPAGASISADIAGVQSDTDNIQTRLPASLVSGRIDASVGAVANDAITAASLASDAGTEIGTAVWATTTRILTAGTNIALAKGVGVTGFNDLSAAAVNAECDTAIADAALATAASLATVAGYVDTEVAAVKAVTDKLDTMLEAATGSPGESRFSADALVNAPTGGAAPTVAEIADAVWDEALSGHATGGSAGAALANVLVDTAEIGTAGAGLTALASAANLAAVAGYIDTEVAAIKAKTDNLPASPAGTGDIPSAAAIADAVWDEALSGHTTSGAAGAALRDADLRGSRTVVRGTVGNSTSPSTTQFTPSALSPAGAAADQFKGRLIAFDTDTATPELRGQLTDITASTAASLPLFTFTALTTAPSSGDTFSIL